MIYGIGTDILKISNIEQSVTDIDDPFVRKVYTFKELKLIQSKPTPLFSFATRFCGKEAVFKCLNIDGNSIRLNEIEILEHTNGCPFVNLHGAANKISKETGISRILISLSYDTDYATAYAIAEI